MSLLPNMSNAWRGYGPARRSRRNRPRRVADGGLWKVLFCQTNPFSDSRRHRSGAALGRRVLLGHAYGDPPWSWTNEDPRCPFLCGSKGRKVPNCHQIKVNQGGSSLIKVNQASQFFAMCCLRRWIGEPEIDALGRDLSRVIAPNRIELLAAPLPSLRDSLAAGFSLRSNVPEVPSSLWVRRLGVDFLTADFLDDTDFSNSCRAFIRVIRAIRGPSFPLGAIPRSLLRLFCSES